MRQNDGSLFFDTSIDVDSFKKDVGKLKSIGKTAIAGLAGLATTVLGIGIAYNSEIESYTAGFETMLGSATAANDALSDLKGFAEKTPFELSDLAAASTTLLAFGEGINDLMPDLKTLGDISLGNKEKFSGLALVFGQVKSQGRLMGQDLLQMINQGFNPLQVISKKTGESMASLKDKMSKGQISFEMVADAMRTATSEGGQFYNAMEKQSKTFTGQISTLKDNVNSLFGEMSMGASSALTESVLPMAIGMVEDLKEAWADGTLKTSIQTNAVLIGIAAAGVAGYRLQAMAAAAAQALFNTTLSLNPAGLAVAGITALAAATAGVVIAVKNADSEWYKLGESIDEAGAKFDTAKEKSTVTQEKIDTWRQLKSEIDNNKLSGEKLAAAQSKVKECEQWFIDNYGNYITAEEEKNGIRAETVDLVEKEAEALTKISALELENELLDTSSDIPELEKKVEALKKTNAALEEEQVNVQSNRNTMQQLLKEWDNFQKSTDALDEEKVKAKFEEIRQAAEGIVDLDFNIVAAQLVTTVDEFDRQAEKIAKSVADNNEKIADGAASISSYYEGVQKLIDFDPNATLEEKVALAQRFGADFTNGIVKGLDVTSPAVVAEIDSLVEDMLTAARKKAGINSPSKKARDLIGKPVSEGVAVGIEKNAVLAAKAAGGLMDTVLAAAQKEADINSPSGVMRDEVGKYLSLGVAQGIEENSDAAVESFGKMLDKLDYQREFDIINDEEYYTELEKLRDKYFKIGSKEWLDYTQQIYDYQKQVLEDEKRDIEDLYSDIASYANEKIDEVISRQQSFVSKLSSYGSLFDTNTVNMGDETFTYYSMHDFEKDTQAITTYCDNLQKLKERLTSLGTDENTIKSFISALSAEDIDTGTAVLNTLLSADEDKLSKYITGYAQKNATSEKLAATHYKDEMDAAVSSSIENMKQKLTDAGYEIPEGFFVSGSISAEKFGEAFCAELDRQMKEIRDKVTIFNTKLEMELSGIGNAAASGNTNNYSPTYTVIAAEGESTTEQLAAIRNKETLNRMRGGY